MSVRRSELIAAGSSAVVVDDINPVEAGRRLQIWASTPVDGGVLTVDWGSISPFKGIVNVRTDTVELDKDGVCDVAIPAGVKNIALKATVQDVRIHFRYT